MQPASGVTKTVESLFLQQQQQQEVNSSWQYEKGCWEAFHARDNATARFYKERRSGSAASLVHARFLLGVARFGARCADLICKQSVVAQLPSSCGSAEHMLIPLVVNCFACFWCYVVCIETAFAPTLVKMQLALRSVC